MRFAPIIAEARTRSGLTQSELAHTTGVSKRAVWLAENGAGSLQTLIPIISHLRIAISGLPPGHSLGARIKAARLKRGWSLKNLAMRCGLSVPTIRGLEQNAGRIESLEAVIMTLAPEAQVRRPRKPLAAASYSPVCSTIQKVVHGDCLEVLPTLDAGSISLVVTSPPYNAGKPYEDVLTEEEYTNFAEQWIACIPRLLRPDGSLWLNVGYMKVSETTTLPLTYLYYPILESMV